MRGPNSGFLVLFVPWVLLPVLVLPVVVIASIIYLVWFFLHQG